MLRVGSLRDKYSIGRDHAGFTCAWYTVYFITYPALALRVSLTLYLVKVTRCLIHLMSVFLIFPDIMLSLIVHFLVWSLGK